MDLRTRLNKKFSEEYGFYRKKIKNAGARKTNALIDSYLKGSQGRSSFMFHKLHGGPQRAIPRTSSRTRMSSRTSGCT